MAVATGDDFEFDSDSENENGWDDDIDIIDETDQILQKSKYDSTIMQDNECWKCQQCSTINNVKLTVEKYNLKCCGCTYIF